VLAAVNNDTLKTSIKIKSFMDENIKEKIRILSSVLDVDNNKQINLTSCSLRSKDPEWFQGNCNDYLSIIYKKSFVYLCLPGSINNIYIYFYSKHTLC